VFALWQIRSNCFLRVSNGFRYHRSTLTNTVHGHGAVFNGAERTTSNHSACNNQLDSGMRERQRELSACFVRCAAGGAVVDVMGVEQRQRGSTDRQQQGWGAMDIELAMIYTEVWFGSNNYKTGAWRLIAANACHEHRRPTRSPLYPLAPAAAAAAC